MSTSLHSTCCYAKIFMVARWQRCWKPRRWLDSQARRWRRVPRVYFQQSHPSWGSWYACAVTQIAAVAYSWTCSLAAKRDIGIFLVSPDNLSLKWPHSCICWRWLFDPHEAFDCLQCHGDWDWTLGRKLISSWTCVGPFYHHWDWQSCRTSLAYVNRYVFLFAFSVLTWIYFLLAYFSDCHFKNLI